MSLGNGKVQLSEAKAKLHAWVVEALKIHENGKREREKWCGGTGKTVIDND